MKIQMIIMTGVLALAILPGGAVPVFAAETAAPTERPRIGLVLGGGGARGAAHIGVLRELERMHIPIDAIAGTSMGAIVGGLYASGMTPDQIEALMKSIDWADAFNDDAQREDLSFRRKQDDESFLVKFDVGIKDGELQLPRGIIQGQKLSLILRQQLLPVSHIKQFDQLPTPFRAVASDLVTGEARQLKDGDLGLAMRASMSAPGIFAPVVVGDWTLVDGGLVGNVPVNAIREMDVDLIIAVDVEFPLYAPNELESALDVTGQMLTILIRRETRRQLDTLSADDILIRPDLGNYASTNFGQLNELIIPGEEATQQVADQLQHLAVPSEEYEQLLAARHQPPKKPRIASFVNVIDDGPLSARVLEARLKTRVGAPIDPAVLAEDAARIYGLELYEQVDYQVVEREGKVGVEFRARSKSWGPNYLQIGLSLEDDFEGSAGFNAAARYTRTGINALGAEWRTDIQLGTEPALVSEFYQPLSFDSRYFIAPHMQFEQWTLNEFSGADVVTQYRVGKTELGLDVGRELGGWGEVRIGLKRGTGSATVKVGDPLQPGLNFETGGLFTRLAYDKLDDAYFPTRGSRFELEWNLSRTAFGAYGDFDTVHADITTVKSFGKNTLQWGLNISSTLQSDNQIQEYFPLGGFLNLSGIDRGQLSGPQAGVARMVYYRRMGETGGGVFDLPWYLGGSLETGNVWQSRSDIKSQTLLLNGSLFAGLDTFFGPLFLAAGIAEGGGTSFYLFLGAPPR